MKKQKQKHFHCDECGHEMTALSDTEFKCPRCSRHLVVPYIAEDEATRKKRVETIEAGICPLCGGPLEADKFCYPCTCQW